MADGGIADSGDRQYSDPEKILSEISRLDNKLTCAEFGLYRPIIDEILYLEDTSCHSSSTPKGIKTKEPVCLGCVGCYFGEGSRTPEKTDTLDDNSFETMLRKAIEMIGLERLLELYEQYKETEREINTWIAELERQYASLIGPAA